MTFECVAGIDPSLSSTGVAVISTGQRPELYRVKSAPPPPECKDDWTVRDVRISDIIERTAEYIPRRALVIMESPFIPSKTSAGGLVDRLGLWWRMYHHLAARMGCTMLPMTPQARMKYATGKGNAHKDVVLAAVIKRYASVTVTGNDEADALVYAAMGCRLNQSPLDDEDGGLPLTHLGALKGIMLPDPSTDECSPFTV